MVDADAIPLDERKFRIVETTRFAVAINMRDLIDVAASGRQQSFHRIFGRRVQKAILSIDACGNTCKVNVSDGTLTQRRRFYLQSFRRGEVVARNAQHFGAKFESAKRGSGTPVVHNL